MALWTDAHCSLAVHDRALQVGISPVLIKEWSPGRVKVPSIESVSGVAWVGALILTGAFVLLGIHTWEGREALLTAQAELRAEVDETQVTLLLERVTLDAERAADWAAQDIALSLADGAATDQRALLQAALDEVWRVITPSSIVGLQWRSDNGDSLQVGQPEGAVLIEARASVAVSEETLGQVIAYVDLGPSLTPFGNRLGLDLWVTPEVAETRVDESGWGTTPPWSGNSPAFPSADRESRLRLAHEGRHYRISRWPLFSIDSSAGPRWLFVWRDVTDLHGARQNELNGQLLRVFAAYLAAQLLFFGALQQVGRATRRLSIQHAVDLLDERRMLIKQRAALETLTTISALRVDGAEARLQEALRQAGEYLGLQLGWITQCVDGSPQLRVLWQSAAQGTSMATLIDKRLAPDRQLSSPKVEVGASAADCQTLISMPFAMGHADWGWVSFALPSSGQPTAPHEMDRYFVRLFALWVGSVLELESHQQGREQMLTRLEHLTTHVPGMVFELRMGSDQTLRMPYASAGALDVLGEPPWALLNDIQGLLQRVHPDDIKAVREALARSLQQRAVWWVEFRYEHPTRGEVWLRAEATPQAYSELDTAWYGFVLDITTRKRVDERVASVYAEIQVARAQTEALIDSTSGTAIMVTDVKGMITRFSHSAEALTGFSANEVVDLARPGDYLRGGGDSLMEAESLARRAPGEAARFECQLLHRDASAVPVRVTVTRLPFANDKPDDDAVLLWVMTDISELAGALQAAREAAAKLQTVTDRVPVQISQLDAELRYVFCNPLYAEAWNISAAQALGRTPAEVLGHRAAAPLLGHLQRALQGEDHEQVIAPHDHQWLSVRYIPHRVDGTIVGLFIVAVDITERMQREAMQKAFISTVSHELRTPLTAINGVLGLVNGGALGTIPPEALEVLEMAQLNGKRLTHLVNDLLDMDKLASGKLITRPEALSVREMLQEAVMLNRPYAETCQITLVLEALPEVWIKADPQRVQQVMANLISNAAKFSPAGSKVTISARRVEDQVRIDVSDDGPGIPLVFQPRVFEKFAQADDSDRRVSHGSGLGLPIARDLVELMGGDIGFDSAVGQGTRFWFTLPEADPQNDSYDR